MYCFFFSYSPDLDGCSPSDNRRRQKRSNPEDQQISALGRSINLGKFSFEIKKQLSLSIGRSIPKPAGYSVL